MNADSPLSPDDLLAQAEAALRQTSLGEGPSREALDRTLAALRAAEEVPRVVPFFRRAMRLAKIAAVFVVSVTVVFGLSERVHFRPTVAFGEIAQKLHDAQTLIYRIRLESPDLKEPQVEKVYVKGRALMRMETNGQVTVGNRALGKTIVLDREAKTALIVDVKRVNPQGEAIAPKQEELVDHLRNLVKSDGQPAGEKEITGRKALGFRTKEGQLDWLVWADAQTKEPLLAEVDVSQGIKLTLSGFELNPPLDDSLFSLDVPEGYTIQKRNLEVTSGEESLTRFLRAYAETADNAFPPRLDDWAAIGKHFGDAWEKNGKPSKTDKLSTEALQLASNVAGVAVFLMPLKQYAYRPEGAKLGDAGQIIFCYRPAEGKRYRALSADLRWSDVEADPLL